MGRFLDRLKNVGKKVDNKINSISQQRQNMPRRFHNGRIQEQRPNRIGEGMYPKENLTREEKKEKDMEDDYFDDGEDDYNDPYEANIQQSQKTESYHRFILENKYKDLERSIRGYKDVFNKVTQKWEVKRKEIHCFTDEEAESIVRTAQVHLSTDIKLSRMSLEAFGQMMNLIYDEIERFFIRIMEYRYGRYGSYELQSKMKDENLKILVELYNSIWANYSRAVGGKENDSAHDSVRGQESLQNSGMDDYRDNGRSFR